MVERAASASQPAGAGSEALTASGGRATVESMLAGRLGYLGSCLALGLACFSCSDEPAQRGAAQGGAAQGGAAQGGAAQGGAAQGGAAQDSACDVAGRETDVCRVWVKRRIACSASTDPEDTLLTDCRAHFEDYPNRVAPCFVAELGECLATGCGSDDQCYTDAIVANDPSVVDIERYRACNASDMATGCDDVVVGFLKECLERAKACSVFDDLCASIVTMKEPYRSDGEACLERSCTELEGCLYAAMGRTAPSR